MLFHVDELAKDQPALEVSVPSIPPSVDGQNNEPGQKSRKAACQQATLTSDLTVGPSMSVGILKVFVESLYCVT